MEQSNILKNLQKILKTLNQIWDDDEQLLTVFIDEMRAILQASYVFLVFIAPDKDPKSIKFIEVQPDRFSRTLIMSTMEKKQTTFIPDTTQHKEPSESMGQLGMRSIICTPFNCSDAIEGAFYVDRLLHFGPFVEEECRFVEIACEQLAHIVRNSRQHRETLEKRIVDATWKKKINWGMVGQSIQMKAICEQIRSLSDEKISTVLIIGETGTGKEMVAHALHYNSPRKKRPFVAVNCAAIPHSLLESELFGYEQGAFSGANSRKLGRLDLAQGGTLFLDELSEIPTETQVKLLRILQEKEFERLGGTKKIKMDVRIIAASNQDPRHAIAEGKIRFDFYQRLAVHIIEIPPLRERVEDIILLAKFFVAQKNGVVKELSPEACEKLQNYNWLGNIRELENTIERAVFLSKDHSNINKEDIQFYSLYPAQEMPNNYSQHFIKQILESPEAKVIIEQIVQETLEKIHSHKADNLEEFIINKLKEGKLLSCRELREGSGYEKRTVQKTLKKLINEKKIKIIGSSKAICYQLITQELAQR